MAISGAVCRSGNDVNNVTGNDAMYVGTDRVDCLAHKMTKRQAEFESHEAAQRKGDARNEDSKQMTIEVFCKESEKAQNELNGRNPSNSQLRNKTCLQ